MAQHIGRSLYGVFTGSTRETAQWQLLTRKREALALARKLHGRVGVVHDAYAWGAPHAWDAPTFYTTMELLADYRQGA